MFATHSLVQCSTDDQITALGKKHKMLEAKGQDTLRHPNSILRVSMTWKKPKYIRLCEDDLSRHGSSAPAGEIGQRDWADSKQK